MDQGGGMGRQLGQTFSLQICSLRLILSNSSNLTTFSFNRQILQIVLWSLPYNSLRQLGQVLLLWYHSVMHLMWKQWLQFVCTTTFFRWQTLQDLEAEYGLSLSFQMSISGFSGNIDFTLPSLLPFSGSSLYLHFL